MITNFVPYRVLGTKTHFRALQLTFVLLEFEIRGCGKLLEFECFRVNAHTRTFESEMMWKEFVELCLSVDFAMSLEYPQCSRMIDNICSFCGIGG